MGKLVRDSAHITAYKTLYFLFLRKILVKINKNVTYEYDKLTYSSKWPAGTSLNPKIGRTIFTATTNSKWEGAVEPANGGKFKLRHSTQEL